MRNLWLSMKIDPKIYVVLGILMTAAAQIFLKVAGTHNTFHLKWLAFIFLSLFSYFVAFLAYYLALTCYDISKIAPIMMASIVSLVALYGFTTGESFNYQKLLGIVLALISILLISRS